MLKVAVIGPESTGKSELANKLAKHYKGVCVPEYAREYVEKLGRPYTFDDVCHIAQHQITQEKYYSEQSSPDFLVFDTELIITKVWLMYCYKQCPDDVQKQIDEGFFDLYLLCEPDLPWEFDPVREHRDDRDFFFDWYKREIELTGKPCFNISGTGNERTQKAIQAIETFIRTQKL